MGTPRKVLAQFLLYLPVLLENAAARGISESLEQDLPPTVVKQVTTQVLRNDRFYHEVAESIKALAEESRPHARRTSLVSVSSTARTPSESTSLTTGAIHSAKEEAIAKQLAEVRASEAKLGHTLGNLEHEKELMEALNKQLREVQAERAKIRSLFLSASSSISRRERLPHGRGRRTARDTRADVNGADYDGEAEDDGERPDENSTPAYPPAPEGKWEWVPRQVHAPAGHWKWEPDH